MPHFIIEQGNALITSDARQEAMQLIGQVGAECGFINAKDIKIRLQDYNDFLLLDGRKSFIHLTVRMLAGRTAEQKEGLTIALRDALCRQFPHVESLSIEIDDMDPISYKKHLGVQVQ